MKIPFMPSVYDHAAYLIGKTPREVYRDEELIFTAHRTAYLKYRHIQIVVGIDIYNLEAEAYGAELVAPEGCGLPAVVEPLFRSIEETRAMKPFDPRRDGRIAMMIRVGRRLAHEFPEVDVRIPVSGPFSIAVSLRGITGLLEDVAGAPEAVRDWLIALAKNQGPFCEIVMEAGLDVAFFESAAAPPLLSPRQFHNVELPALTAAMAVAASRIGHPVPCIIGGDTTPILDDILGTGTGFVICPAETNPRAFLEKSKIRPQVKVRINMNPHTLEKGTPEEILSEVDTILELAKIRPNCLLGTGALPYATPPDNIRLIRDYVA